MVSGWSTLVSPERHVVGAPEQRRCTGRWPLQGRHAANLARQGSGSSVARSGLGNHAVRRRGKFRPLIVPLLSPFYRQSSVGIGIEALHVTRGNRWWARIHTNCLIWSRAPIRTQNPAGASPCRFESDLRHQRDVSGSGAPWPLRWSVNALRLPRFGSTSARLGTGIQPRARNLHGQGRPVQGRRRRRSDVPTGRRGSPARCIASQRCGATVPPAR